MKLIVGVILLLTLIACASTPVVINRTSVAQLQKQGQLTQVQDYKIQVGDELDIKLYYNPELNDRVPVRPDGRISLQLVGEIMVFDMTPAPTPRHQTVTGEIFAHLHAHFAGRGSLRFG